MQPVTIRARILPSFLSFASSRISSIDSAFADSMKPQVFTMAASAPAASSLSTKPASRRRAIIISASTRFFSQPRLIIPTEYAIPTSPSIL